MISEDLNERKLGTKYFVSRVDCRLSQDSPNQRGWGSYTPVMHPAACSYVLKPNSSSPSQLHFIKALAGYSGRAFVVSVARIAVTA